MRICNLPAAFARGAPATETTLVQLIYQHTGIPTFNPRTGTKMVARHSNFAYAFVDVHTYDDGVNLIAAITNIVTDNTPWLAEWSHDSYASLMADTYSLTNPDFPNLTFLQHHIRGTLRVTDNSTGLPLPWAHWPSSVRPLVPPPTFDIPTDVVSIHSTPTPMPTHTATPTCTRVLP